MKKKMFAALALSATLAMGAVPAFAADTADKTGEATDVTTADGKASSSTTVKVQTIASNITATIPLSITVVGPAEGGNLSGVPSNYKIVNKSVYPIKVTEVKADMTDITDWGLATAAQTTDSKSSKKVGDLFLTLQADGAAKALTVSQTAASPTDWIVKAKDADGDKENVITVAGSVSQINSVNEDATTAVKVQYTIAPTTTTTA